MNRLSLTISIFLYSFIPFTASSQSTEKLSITHGPYLQNVSDTAATIIFTTNKLVVPGVYLSCDGADFKLIRNSTDGLINVGDDIHKVRLTGLKPGKEYSYKLYVKEVLDMRPYVNLDGKYGDSIISEVFKFKTLDRSADEIKFTVFNDTHNKAGMISRLLDVNDIEAQDFYFYNGDIINYVKDLELPFRAFLDTSVNRFASQIPFFYVRGNHETRGTYAKEFKKFYFVYLKNLESTLNKVYKELNLYLKSAADMGYNEVILTKWKIQEVQSVDWDRSEVIELCDQYNISYSGVIMSRDFDKLKI